jgi:hypothetical protein
MPDPGRIVDTVEESLGRGFGNEDWSLGFRILAHQGNQDGRGKALVDTVVKICWI